MWNPRNFTSQNRKDKKSYLLRSLFENVSILSPVPEYENCSSPVISSTRQYNSEIYYSNSALPELIIEKEANRHDEPDQFYKDLETKAKMYYNKLFMNLSKKTDHNVFASELDREVNSFETCITSNENEGSDDIISEVISVANTLRCQKDSFYNSRVLSSPFSHEAESQPVEHFPTNLSILDRHDNSVKESSKTLNTTFEFQNNNEQRLTMLQINNRGKKESVAQIENSPILTIQGKKYKQFNKNQTKKRIFQVPSKRAYEVSRKNISRDTSSVSEKITKINISNDTSIESVKNRNKTICEDKSDNETFKNFYWNTSIETDKETEPNPNEDISRKSNQDSFEKRKSMFEAVEQMRDCRKADVLLSSPLLRFNDVLNNRTNEDIDKCLGGSHIEREMEDLLPYNLNANLNSSTPKLTHNKSQKKKRKFENTGTQTFKDKKNVDSATLTKNLFFGAPLIYKLCQCKHHKCDNF